MLREWRKTVATNDAVPVYTIFTNEQLAEIAKKKVLSKSELNEVAGVGPGRLEKYGDSIIELIAGNKTAETDQ